MFMTQENRLGIPQTPVTMTSADWLKFLGRDGQTGTPPLPYPGQIIRATSPIFGESMFMSAYGVAGLQIGDAVGFLNNYATVRTVAATRAVIGISMAANTDPTALSWFCIQGQVPTRALVGGLLPLYASATAGSLTATVTAGQAAVGAFSLTALAATVTTKVCNTTSGSNLIQVPDINGLYVGMGVTGTGIPGGTTIANIGYGGLMLGWQGPPANVVQLSANATATGGATMTFAHGANFVTALLQYPCIPGAV